MKNVPNGPCSAFIEPNRKHGAMCPSHTICTLEAASQTSVVSWLPSNSVQERYDLTVQGRESFQCSA